MWVLGGAGGSGGVVLVSALVYFFGISFADSGLDGISLVAARCLLTGLAIILLGSVTCRQRTSSERYCWSFCLFVVHSRMRIRHSCVTCTC